MEKTLKQQLLDVSKQELDYDNKMMIDSIEAIEKERSQFIKDNNDSEEIAKANDEFDKQISKKLVEVYGKNYDFEKKEIISFIIKEGIQLGKWIFEIKAKEESGISEDNSQFLAICILEGINYRYAERLSSILNYKKDTKITVKDPETIVRYLRLKDYVQENGIELDTEDQDMTLIEIVTGSDDQNEIINNYNMIKAFDKWKTSKEIKNNKPKSNKGQK